MGKTFDCAGWATRANMLCADGRIIMKDAFKDCDGATVPLVWNHQHNNIEEVLGHALLENRDDGVYAYCTFNTSEGGQHAKLCVQNGDIRHFSIYANKLKHQGCNVIHGAIREVSLVLAGANPGAYIESVMMHGEDSCEEGRIYSDDQYIIEDFESLFHADTDKSEEEKGETKMAENKDKTVKEVFDTLNEEQKTVVYALIGQIVEEKTNESDESEGGKEDMKHNVFEQDEKQYDAVLSHSEIQAIVSDAKSCGSLKEAVLAHGIEDLDIMFPDHQTLNNEPEFIKRDDDWVAKVLGGVHHTPFARVKTVFADVTAAEARAKGYHKGNLKIEEVFKLLKRVTGPTTVYKKQKLDRDDMIDLDKSFNLLPFLKKEIRMMLNEEMARAFLVGDGRDPVEEANDKINEECIRPIWKMEELFTVKVPVAVKSTATDEERAKAFIKACKKSRKQYKGSGNPSMFMSEDMLTDCLLIEDGIGHPLYPTIDNLKAALRVSEIVPVPVMEGLTRTDDAGKTFELAAIYVNLKDYNVGTDKGGEIGFFEDFDLDYNQQKYLMETRCSGTLVKPYSAVALEFVVEE